MLFCWCERKPHEEGFVLLQRGSTGAPHQRCVVCGLAAPRSHAHSQTHGAFLHSPTSPPALSLLGRGSHSFLWWLHKTWAAPSSLQLLQHTATQTTLLLAMLQPIASRLRGCQLLAALRVGRSLRSVRGRKSVSLHSADTILFFKRKLSSLCISVSVGTSRHTSDPATLPPAESSGSLKHLVLGLAQKP